METIITKTGKLPGKTLAIFAGIHGNETAGISVVEQLLATIHLERGTVHFVFGNPRAIEQKVRYTESNLNRDFISTLQPTTYEQKRARTLMELLNSCDALLDLHAYRSDTHPAIPFAICEPRCHPIVAQFDLPFSIAGIAAFQAGSTNGYMEQQEKIGIVIELGALERPEDFTALGLDCALRFLAHFGAIGPSSRSTTTTPKYLHVAGVYRKNTEQFTFTKQYHSFDTVAAHEPIATDADLTISATADGRILFPSASDAVGIEAFWLLSSSERATTDTNDHSGTVCK